MHPRPKLFVSRCLGFEACRYNGAVIEDRLVALLADYCDIVTACPEKDTGLGIPRDPLRLVRVGPETRMIQPATGRDHTAVMMAYCAAKAAELAGTTATGLPPATASDAIISPAVGTATGLPPADPTAAGLPPADPTAAGLPSADPTAAGRPPTGLPADRPPAGQSTSRPPAGLPAVDGALLKSRSPSCGMKDVKIYRSITAGAMFDTGSGLFGQAVLDALDGAPVEDEGRLRNYTIREHFLSCLFALARFRTVAQSGGSRELTEYQARHKLLFLAINQALMRRLGRIAANLEKRPFPEVLSAYRAELSTLFSSPAKPGSIINTALHAFGGVSDRLSPAERKLFLDAIEEYRDERIPASAILTLLKSWAVRFEVHYLLDQVFLDPFPKALVEITDSGKGRDH
jgi:uncharacterized protein YbgA (DUF1722 family)/uncharacterized protein YbbK (DUF523 family)